MKRVLFLILGLGLPIVLLLYPGFRRALAGRLRLVLVIYGALLVTLGGIGLFAQERTPREMLVGGLGLLVLVVAVLGVARDGVRS